MTKWILGVLAFVALVVPAAAAAEPFTPELESDYSAALAWWGVSSPPQCSSVTRELLPADPYGRAEANADATEPSPGASEIECKVWVFADRLYPGCPEEMIIRHEIGHLLGYPHDPDPESIMAERIDFNLWCPSPASATPEASSPVAVPGPIISQEDLERLRSWRQTDWREWRHRRARCHHHASCLAKVRSEGRTLHRAWGDSS